MEKGKFHPHTQYQKGTRKSRDQSAKEEGIRKSRNKFHPKGYKPPTFGKKKPAGKWEITKTDYSGSKNVEIFTDSVHIYDNNGQEVVMWDSKEWKDDPSIIPAIKNYIKLAKEGRVDEIKKMVGFIERGTVDRDPYPTSFASRKARGLQSSEQIAKEMVEMDNYKRLQAEKEHLLSGVLAKTNQKHRPHKTLHGMMESVPSAEQKKAKRRIAQINKEQDQMFEAMLRNNAYVH